MAPQSKYSSALATPPATESPTATPANPEYKSKYSSALTKYSAALEPQTADSPSGLDTAIDYGQGLAASFGVGANALLGLSGTLYGLASGEMDNWAVRQGEFGRKYWQDRKGDQLKAAEQRRQKAMDAAEGEWAKLGTAVWETMGSATLLSAFLAEQIPMFLPGAQLGRGAAAVRVGIGAKAAQASGAAAVKALQASAAKIGTGTAIGTGAALQGADSASQAYEQLKALKALPDVVWAQNPQYKALVSDGMDPAAAQELVMLSLSRNTFAAASLVSLVTNMIPGAKSIEKSLQGVKSPAGSRLLNAAKDFVGESLQEGVEEGTGALFANIAESQVNEAKNIWEGVGEATGMGLAAGPLGAISGFASGQSSPDDIRSALKEQVEKELAAAALLSEAEQPLPLGKIDLQEKDGVTTARLRLSPDEEYRIETDDPAVLQNWLEDVRKRVDNQAKADSGADPMAVANEIMAADGSVDDIIARAIGVTDGIINGNRNQTALVEEAAAEVGLPLEGSAAGTVETPRTISQIIEDHFSEVMAAQAAMPSELEVDNTGRVRAPTTTARDQGVDIAGLVDAEGVDAVVGEALGSTGIINRRVTALQREAQAVAAEQARINRLARTGPDGPLSITDMIAGEVGAETAGIPSQIRVPTGRAETPARPGFLEDIIFNGDLVEGIERVVMSDSFDNEKDSVPLNNVGFTNDEVAALEEAGLATDGRMNIKQYQAYMAERLERTNRPRPTGRAAVPPIETPPSVTRDEPEAPNYIDPRLKRAEFRERLAADAQGLNPGGGGVGKATYNPITDERFRVSGSDNPDWFQTFARTEQVTVKELQTAVNKAIAGERLGPKQQRMVINLLDGYTLERTQQTSNNPSLVDQRRQELKVRRDERRKGMPPSPPLELYENLGEIYTEQVYEQVPEMDFTARAIYDLSVAVEELGGNPDEILATASDPGMAIDALETSYEELINARRQEAGPVEPGQEVAADNEIQQEETDEAQIAIDQAANAAATSPTNDLPEPTEAQKEAGNYKKGKPFTLSGLRIVVENPRGSKRKGTDPDGREWSNEMLAHYGDIKQTVGAEGNPGEGVDVFVGQSPGSKKVWIVDAIDQDTGAFDEHKVLMGFTDKESALDAYLGSYNAGSVNRPIEWEAGPVSEVTVDELKKWLDEGDQMVAFDPDFRAEQVARAEREAELEAERANAPKPMTIEEQIAWLDSRDLDGADLSMSSISRAKAMAQKWRDAGVPEAKIVRGLDGRRVSKKKGGPTSEGEIVSGVIRSGGERIKDMYVEAGYGIHELTPGWSFTNIPDTGNRAINEAYIEYRKREAGMWEGDQQTSADPVLDIEVNENLTPEQAQAQADMIAKLTAPGGFAAAVAEYAAIEETKGGRLLNTDVARELSPAYLENRSAFAGAVHNPMSEFVKVMYRERLKMQPAAGEKNIVVFSAGGAGAGKSTGLDLQPDLVADAQTIYDTNASNFDSAVNKIDAALDAGREIKIQYVHRDPVEALVNGALPRAKREEAEFGSGRTVPIESYAETHSGANETIRRLQEHYADNPAVQISVIMNDQGRGNARLGTLQELPELEYNQVLSDAILALDEAFQNGQISEAIYTGFRGTEPGQNDAGTGEGADAGAVQQPDAGAVSPVRRADGPVVRGRDQQRGDARQFPLDLLEATPDENIDNAAATGARSETLPGGLSPSDAEGNEGQGAIESAADGDVRALSGEDGATGAGLPRRSDAVGPEDAGTGTAVPTEPGLPGRAGAEPSVPGDAGLGGDAGRDRQDRSRSVSGSNYVITDADAIGVGGLKAKYKANIEAIKLLKEINSIERDGAVQGVATSEEQAVLAKYVGWGGMPQAFDERNKQWSKEYAELKDLLTDEEYAAALASTPNAHYTSPTIIRGIYSALERFGFTGGRVLEPSSGVGHFIGLAPDAIRGNSTFKAIELDQITGAIASLLYPKSSVVFGRGFQEISLSSDSYDAAVGNPPFGSEKLYDPNHKELKGFSIHNYFFAKSLDKLRPGGVLAMVVSNSLMDKAGATERNYFAKHADLLGAIRLPNTAFKGNANTEVTTDIIFLQKREPDTPAGHESWTKVGKIQGKQTNADGSVSDVEIPLNEYFINNPQMMLGDMTLTGTMYRSNTPALEARPGENLADALTTAIEQLPDAVYTPRSKPIAVVEEQSLVVPTDAKVYSYHVSESGEAIVQRLPDIDGSTNVVVSHLGATRVARLKGLIGVRDQLNDLMRLERSPDSKANDISAARAQLNKLYDQHVKKYGAMHTAGNKQIMRDDPEFPRLLSLEHDFEPAISPAVAKKRGVKPARAKWKKADIFTKRVFQPFKPVTTADTAEDGLYVSMNETGRVDIPRIAKLTGKSEEAVISELKGLIYKDNGAWVTAEEYLHGNVKQKLADARQAVKTDPDLADNVRALEEVQPVDKEPVDIKVGLGAHWIPTKYIEAFIDQLLDAKSSVFYAAGRWSVSITNPNMTANAETWGTEAQPATVLLQKILENKEIVVKGKDSEGNVFTDKTASLAANLKADEIRRAFNDVDTGEGWLWSDPDRMKEVAQIFNDNYNTHRTRDHYDGSYLTLPGMSQHKKPHPHVKNAVARILQEGRILADHAVGAGKTWVGVISAMELRRLGLAKKPMIVVPNHLVGQWAREFMELYPGAKVLQTTKRDFMPENRKVLMSRIATGDWDAVVVAHSQFTMIPVPGDVETQFLKDQVKELQRAIDALKEAKGEERTIKQMAKSQTAMEERMKQILDKPTDDTVDFSELGVDAMLIDEAHEFKNLFYSTQMARVGGVGNAKGSKKAFDMFMKIRMVQNEHDQKNVFFFTGTPISNTMVEMYTMQRYMQYQEMEQLGLHHFDAWANVFGNMTTDWELDASGVNYKLKTRFRSFKNMLQLQAMYRSFADVMLLSDLKRVTEESGKVWPVPKIRGGEVEQIIVERSPMQAAYMDSIIKRMENMPADNRIDNHLKATNDARKMALDMRLIDPGVADHPNSKSSVASGWIHELYKKWNDDKGLVLVFIDLSTPKDFKGAEAKRIGDLIERADKGDEEAMEALDKVSMDELMAAQSTFDVYNDLKGKLVDLGIPAEEVRFAHEAKTDQQLQQLHDDARSGKIRVLIGSTAKMGTGTNVQERVVGLLNVDAPWRPSDIEQRIGRAVRQGNKLYERDPEGFEVAIGNMATKQTYDARMWEILQQKAEVIEQVRSGNSGDVVEDISSGAATFSEMKAAATGNPLIQEQVKLTQRVRELESLASSHTRSQHRLQSTVSKGNGAQQRADVALAAIRADIDARAASAAKPWSMTIDGKTYTQRAKADKDETATKFKARNAEIKRKALEQLSTTIAKFANRLGSENGELKGAFEYRGFVADIEKAWGTQWITLNTKSGKIDASYSPQVEGKIDPAGLLTRLDNKFDRLEEYAADVESELADELRAVEEARQQLGKPFPKAAELTEARDRLAEVMAELQRMADPLYVPLDEREEGREYDEDGHLVTDSTEVDRDPPLDSPVRFSMKKTPGQGPSINAGRPVMAYSEVWSAIQGIADKVHSSLPVDIHVVHSNDLPEAVTKWFDEGEEGTIHGVILENPDTGRAEIYLLTDGLDNAKHAQTTLVHELVGHFGVDALVGPINSPNWNTLSDAYYEMRRAAKQNGDPEFDRIQARLKEQYGDVDWLTEIKEFVALASEERHNKGPVAKFMMVVRQLMNKWLRSIGVNRPYGMSEVYDLLDRSEDYITNGTATPKNWNGEVPQFAKRRKPKADKKLFTNEQEAVIEHGGFGLQRRSKAFRARWKELNSNRKVRFRQYWVDKYDSLRNIADSEEAWMKAHLSASSWGAIEAGLEYGHIKLHQDGVLSIDTTTKGLKEILAPLGADVDRFTYWIAGNRANRLLNETDAEGKPAPRERLFNQAQINVLIGMGLDGRRGEPGFRPGREQLFEQVRKEFEAWGQSVTDIAVETGLINAEEAQMWAVEGFYLPFYRVLEDDSNQQGPRMINNAKLVRQEAYKTLKGGTDQLDDLLGNAIANWNHLLAASMKNLAARETLANAETILMDDGEPLAVRHDSQFKAGKDAVFVRVDGKPEWWTFNEGSEGELLMRSLTAMHYNGMQGGFWDLMRKFKRVHTIGITASPEFKVTNLIRDTLQAVAVTGVSPNFLRNVRDGWKATRRDSDQYAQMLASGAIFAESGYIHGADPEAIRYLVSRGVERDTILDTRMGIRKAFDKYQDLGARAENVNRAGEYAQKEGYNELQRAFAARDHLDFTRTGAGPVAMFLASNVSFLNARMQGLDKVARSLKDPNQRKRFAATLGTYSLISVAAYLLAQGEDDWDEIEDWERDTYHMFKVGDTWLRLPRPFELGAMANMIERGVEQFVDNDVQGRVFAERFAHAIFETLSFNPIPQAAMPMIEHWNNRNWFLDRPIESAGMQMSGVSTSNRSGPGTSETAIALSKGMEGVIGQGALSPVQIDHLVNGYFGWLGATTMFTLDMLATRPLSDSTTARPETKFSEYPVVKRFVKRAPSGSTKFTTEFYDQMEELNRVWADIQLARKQGDRESAEQQFEENRDLLRNRNVINSTRERLSDVNARRRMVLADKEMDSATKRRQLDELQRVKNELTKRAVTATRQ